MATINDLATSISEMLPHEALSLIERIQKSRLLLKINKFNKKTKRVPTEKKKKSKSDILKSIDKQELLRLLKESMK
jgi:hypothetical protein